MLANEYSHTLHDMVDTLSPGSSLVHSRTMMSLSSCFCKQGGNIKDSDTHASTQAYLGSEFFDPRANRKVRTNVSLPLVYKYLLLGRLTCLALGAVAVLTLVCVVVLLLTEASSVVVAETGVVSTAAARALVFGSCC